MHSRVAEAYTKRALNKLARIGIRLNASELHTAIINSKLTGGVHINLERDTGVDSTKHDIITAQLALFQEDALAIKSLIDCYEFAVDTNKFKAKNGLFSAYPINKLPMPLIGVSFLKNGKVVDFPFVTLIDTGDSLILNGKPYRYFRIVVNVSLDFKVAYTYIPELHPRLFHECQRKCDRENSKRFKYGDGSGGMTADVNNIYLNSSNEADEPLGKAIARLAVGGFASSWLPFMRDFEGCLLSPRTIEWCDPQGKGMLSILDVVWSVLESFITRGENVSRTGIREENDRRDTQKTRLKEKATSRSNVISLVYNRTGEELMTLTNSRWRKTKKQDSDKPGTHASPREHVRKEHLRQYKDGRIVYIGQTTVNRGKEKTKYEFRTAGSKQ